MKFKFLKYKSLWLFILVGMFGLNTVFAQQVTFRANAPKVVSVGERFQLSYTLNAQGSDLKPGNLASFQVLSGPNASQQTSVQIVNGQMQQSFNMTYTYILQANKAGEFNISAGKIKVEGKEYRSNTLKIQAVQSQSGNAGNNAGASGRRNNATPNNAGNNAAVAAGDLYLRMFISKKEVLKGEPVVATLKLYTKVGLANLGNFKAPAFNGFWSEILREATNLNFQRENVNGQVYNTAVIQQHVLIPERTGELTIEPAELTAVAQIRVQNRRQSRSLFNQFFGGVQNVEKVLSSPTIKLKVNPLPGTAPPSYEGAIGKINLTATLDPKETKTNEAISLKVTYGGTGNLKLLSEPKLKFPSDFEVYDPKVSNNYSAGANGYSGNKTFEYLIIPRHEGEYEIPAIQFAAFDLESKQYKTQTAGPFQISVAKGEGGAGMNAIDLGSLKEDVQVLGEDIRYIHTNDVELREKDRPFFGSLGFYCSYLLSLGLFSLAFVVLKRQRRRSEDVVYMKNKKAGKVAQTRLKQASTFMQQNDRTAFYKEILHALWGYLSDKLNISQGKLKKETIKENLANREVPENLQTQLFDLVNRCEFAQFAPGGGSDELSGVYDETAQLIGELEQVFRK